MKLLIGRDDVHTGRHPARVVIARRVSSCAIDDYTVHVPHALDVRAESVQVGWSALYSAVLLFYFYFWIL